MKTYVPLLCLLVLASTIFANPETNKSTLISIAQREALFDAVKDKQFIWGSNDGPFDPFLKLKANGTIKIGYESHNEKYWDINKYGQLVIYNIKEEVQWIFIQSEQDGKMYFRTTTGNGHYLLER